ncbi:D-alanine--D-alanine ligase [candidate division GN15 bacterium]|uniref:D-alanine--D-alanine ligase n=1 Tax=candidate division GN15 bacterium TaxID=2072418 RepID=A0A855X4F6_9BACT|nr:MAG: D-alanine--D-alanine ligase [candidate division GN15 bacterium]
MKVLLLAGGDSSEKEVSLRSGAAIYDALKHLGHEVLAINPSGGHSLVGADGKFMTALPPHVNPTSVQIADTRAISTTFKATDFGKAELVVIALHGGSGENGTIQSLLDLSGVKYTGSGMAASAIAMDKAITKRLFVSEGIPTPRWEQYRWKSEADDPAIAADILRKFDFPLIVKPNNSGSTVGLTKVKDEPNVIPAIHACVKESPDILVEEFIPGRELTVSVIEGEALPLVEIVPKNELYDYEAKYTKGMSNYIAPAEVEPWLARGMQETAVKAFNVIGASGLVRVDFILSPENEYYCLEVNTLPGMTNLSLAPMAAKVAGMTFDDLVARIVDSAMRK